MRAILRDLMSRDADVAIGPLILTENRLKSDSYSFYVYPTEKNFSVIINKNLLQFSSLNVPNLMLERITITVWLIVVVSIILATTIISFSRLINARHPGKSLVTIVSQIANDLITSKFGELSARYDFNKEVKCNSRVASCVLIKP